MGCYPEQGARDFQYVGPNQIMIRLVTLPPKASHTSIMDITVKAAALAGVDKVCMIGLGDQNNHDML